MNDRTDEIMIFLEKELKEQLAPVYMKNRVDPWVKEKVGHALAARAISAGPTRSGDSVQVRIRLSPKKLICATVRRWSTHDEDRATNTRTLKSRPKLMQLFRTVAITEVLGIQDFEAKIRQLAASALSNSVVKAFPAVASSGRGGRDIAYEVARKYADALGLEKRVFYDMNVSYAMDVLADRMIALILAVPAEAYSRNSAKSEFGSAKKKLLKAMRRAMDAGLSDEDMESVKMVALASHVMES